MTRLRCLRVRSLLVVSSLPIQAPQSFRQIHIAAWNASSRSSRSTRCQAQPAPVPPARCQSTEAGKRVETDAAPTTDIEAELQKYKETRMQRLQRILSGEEQIFAESYPRLKHRAEVMTVADFLEEYKDYEPVDVDPKEVTLYGRITSARRHGSYLLFIDIVNQFQTIQALVNWKTVEVHSQVTRKQFKLFAKLIDRGDHISITGRATRSSSGQLTIEATNLPELLAPALEPLPERFTEEKDRINRRHHDLLINRDVTDRLRLRSSILAYLRQFYQDQGFLEFQTPILADSAGGAVARPFITTSSEVPGKELALRIAPELWLKRLVVGGVDRVFEIGPAFRNEGIDATHNPEFTMCEFYAAYTNLSDLIQETEALVSGMAKYSHELIERTLTSLPPLDPSFFTPPFDFVEFVPAIEKALGISLPDLSSEDALPNLITILQLARINIPGGFPATLPKLLDRLSALCLEPLSYKSPLFIIHHPACMSPLSKEFTCPTTGQRVSARAELFVNGRELANMYEEENDPEEQLRKMVEYHRVSSLARRERERERSLVDDNIAEEVVKAPPAWVSPSNDQDVGEEHPAEVEEDDEEPPPPIDQSYIRALRAGLPPTGGWGCGVERLVMLFSGAKRISDVLSFGTLRNVASLNVPGEGLPDLIPLPDKESKAEEDGQKEDEATGRIDALTKRLTLKNAPRGEGS